MVHCLEVINRMNQAVVDKAIDRESHRRIDMDYPEALLKMWRFVDNDSPRFSIEFVKLDFKNSRLEATNGRIAVRHAVVFPEAFAALEPVLLYGKDVEAAAEFFAPKGKCRGLKLVNIGNKWFAESEAARLRLQTDDGRWPKTDDIFNIPSKRTARFSVDPKLLRSFCHAFVDVENAGGDPSIEFVIPLDGSSLITLKCGRGAIDARLSSMSDHATGKAIVVDEPEA